MFQDDAAKESEPDFRPAAAGWVWGLVLVALLAGRYREWVFQPTPLFDERIYLAAGRALLAGRSPFDAEYLYLPGFAWLSARLLRLCGELPLLVAMRCFNLVAITFLALSGARLAVRLGGLGELPSRLVAAAFLLLSPAVQTGIGSGNTTFPVAALIVIALELAPRRPWPAGLVLGASLVIKPLAPGGVAWLAGCRSAERAWGLRCALPAFALFLLGLCPPSLLPDFLGQKPPGYSGDHNASLYRLAQLAGLEPSPQLWSVAICLGALAVSASRRRAGTQLFHALPAILAATPLVWNHTLCLVWPIEATALALAWRRRAEKPLELVAVAGVILLLAGWQGTSALPPQALAARFALAAMVALAPSALAVYAWRRLPEPG